MVTLHNDKRNAVLDRPQLQNGTATVQGTIDCLVRRHSKFRVNDFVYVDRTPLTMTAEERLAMKRISKFQNCCLEKLDRSG